MFRRLCCLILVLALRPASSFIREENEVVACGDEAVQLFCSSREHILVVYAATFATDGSLTKDRCELDLASNDTCTTDVRLVVNSKCSGFSACKFLVSDLVPRDCYGTGVLALTYGCAPATDVIKFCNTNISGSTAEGFIHNPGYPNYYPGLDRCTWTIRANPGQSVMLSLLDMSMKGSAGNSAVDCTDSLQVYDGNVKVMHSCGRHTDYLHSMVSVSETVRIVFASRDVWPSRGVLFYYRVLGCPTIPAPEHGYLVFRNASTAHYMCCARHVFVDSYRRNRYLYCRNGNRWNGTVVPCKNVKMIRQWGNSTGVEFEEEPTFTSGDPIYRVPLQSVSFVLDIVIPSVIMAGMIISNVIIVLVILKMRKRNKGEGDMMDNGGNHIKTETEPQPSTSKENGLDLENGTKV